MKKIIKHVVRYAAYYGEVQLLVSIISLPILVSWGIPLSYASLLGNLIFAPLFTIFLGASSLMFFTELLHIPNSWIARLLDLISTAIFALLNLGSPSWLVGIRLPSPWIVYLPLIALAIIVTYLAHKPQYTRCLVLAIVLGMSIASYNLTTPHPSTPHIVPNTRDKLVIHSTRNGLILEDHGWFTTRLNPSQYIEFTLRPYLTKTYGTVRFTRIILHAARIRSLKAARTLIELFPTARIMLPRLKENIPSYGWRDYFDLKQYARTHSISLGIQGPCAKNKK